MPFGHFLGYIFIKKVCTAPPNFPGPRFSEGDRKVHLLAKKVCTAPPNSSELGFFRAALVLRFGDFRGLPRALFGPSGQKGLKSASLDRFAIENFTLKSDGLCSAPFCRLRRQDFCFAEIVGATGVLGPPGLRPGHLVPSVPGCLGLFWPFGPKAGFASFRAFSSKQAPLAPSGLRRLRR